MVVTMWRVFAAGNGLGLDKLDARRFDRCECRVRPDEPVRGRREIQEYWQHGAADAQENVEFASQVWAVDNDTAIAGWQASFTRKASGVRVELNGTFRLVFSGEQGALQCTVLEEWWHRRET